MSSFKGTVQSTEIYRVTDMIIFVLIVGATDILPTKIVNAPSVMAKGILNWMTREFVT
jgi:hypothetical protein